MATSGSAVLFVKGMATREMLWLEKRRGVFQPPEPEGVKDFEVRSWRKRFVGVKTRLLLRSVREAMKQEWLRIEGPHIFCWPLLELHMRVISKYM